MDKNFIKELLRHVRPVCTICSCHSVDTDPGTPATRIAYVPEKPKDKWDHVNYWYFCDEHDFKSTISGRGFDEYDFEQEYGFSFPPPHEFVDLSHANAIRAALKEINKSKKNGF